MWASDCARVIVRALFLRARFLATRMRLTPPRTTRPSQLEHGHAHLGERVPHQHKPRDQRERRFGKRAQNSSNGRARRGLE